MLERGFANMFGCTASTFYYTAINLTPFSKAMLWIDYNYNALKPRLKIESFIVNVKTLRKSMDIFTDTEPEQVTVANPWSAWKTKHRVEILETINGIESKSAMNPSDISTKAKSTIIKNTLSKNGSGYIQTDQLSMQ